jgi:hypothetical protein
MKIIANEQRMAGEIDPPILPNGSIRKILEKDAPTCETSRQLLRQLDKNENWLSKNLKDSRTGLSEF